MMEKPQRILIDSPPIGGKTFLVRRKGLFVLEEGPGMLQTLNITHAGSGELSVYDGVPNKDGFFPDEHILDTDPKYHMSNGRLFYHFSPVYMGAWMSNAGFMHGLTIHATGDMAPFVTAVWQATRSGQKTQLPVHKPEPESLTTTKIRDVQAPAFKHSLTRSTSIPWVGSTRIARRGAELYSIMITHSGSFCRVIAKNGKLVPLFDMFSAFVGSFVIGGWAEDGIIIDVEGKQQPPILQVNWREPDALMV